MDRRDGPKRRDGSGPGIRRRARIRGSHRGRSVAAASHPIARAPGAPPCRAGERWTRRCAACHTWVPARLGDLPPVEGRGPCLGQTHRRVVPYAIVGAPAPDREPLDPHLRAPRRDAKIEPVLVKESRRAVGRLNLPYRELAQSRTTIRTSTCASLPDSGWSLKERPATDKHSFISMIDTRWEAVRCPERRGNGGGGVHHISISSPFEQLRRVYLTC